MKNPNAPLGLGDNCMENIIIRHSRESDVDRIVEIALKQWAAIYSTYKELIGEDLYEIWFKNQEQRKADTVTKNALDFEHCIVTEIDGFVVAFAAFSIYNSPSGELVGTLSNNAVDSDFGGRGIGTKQYEYIFEIMRNAGCVSVNVSTGLDDGHAAARRAYEKVGFEKGLPEIKYYKKL